MLRLIAADKRYPTIGLTAALNCAVNYKQKDVMKFILDHPWFN